MGFKFRKSINLGGGFRINLSKSGVGYSWGGKGFRVTKTAKGTTRHTVSIPGTGISYSNESSNKNKNTPTQHASKIQNNYYNTNELNNDKAKDIHSNELVEMIALANKSLKYNKYSTIGIVVTLLLGCSEPFFFLVAAGFIAWKLYIKKNGIIDLNYTINESERKLINEQMAPLKKIAQSNKIWRITQSSSVIDTKYSGGSSSSIKRTPCSAFTTLPFPFRSNEQAVCFKSGKEIFIFLPDKFLIMQKNVVGALNYADLSSSIKGTRFIESKLVPSDAKIVDKTWKYINQNGTPDKRFKDNCELPVCLYGELNLHSKSGNINTSFLFSNPDIE